MAISDTDYKLLWGRAAGICSNPACRVSLFRYFEGKDAYNIGEMAHIIARRPGGRRGIPEGGVDTYGNMILLCPTCHTMIDKAPEREFPPTLLHQWKKDHETDILRYGSSQKFTTFVELKNFVARLLAENHSLWSELGPKSYAASNDPGSNLHRVWDLRKLDTIVPNNTKILTTVEANSGLLDNIAHKAFLKFKLHARSFEANQYRRLDRYPLFPAEFLEIFSP